MSYLNSKIFIAGQKTFVGNSLVNNLKKKKYNNIINNNFSNKDLENYEIIKNFFDKKKPEVVFLIAGMSGGISFNINYPASLISNNISIISNIFKISKNYKIKKLIFMSSSCVYPKNINKDLKPSYLLTKSLEDTNKAYALSKLLGIEMVKSYNIEFKLNYVSVIPSTIFGPGDNFDSYNAHVVSSLINKIHLAKVDKLKEVKLWGSGNPVRDFIYVDDLANSLIFILENYNSSEPINVSSGESLTIKQLSNVIKKIINFKGKITFDKKMPDGMKRKILDIGKIKQYGWTPENLIEEAILKTYKWYLKN